MCTTCAILCAVSSWSPGGTGDTGGEGSNLAKKCFGFVVADALQNNGHGRQSEHGEEQQFLIDECKFFKLPESQEYLMCFKRSHDFSFTEWKGVGAW